MGTPRDLWVATMKDELYDMQPYNTNNYTDIDIHDAVMIEYNKMIVQTSSTRFDFGSLATIALGPEYIAAKTVFNAVGGKKLVNRYMRRL